MSADHPSATPTHSWREAFFAYTRPRVVALLFLGFSAGLPFLLVFSTLSAWLRDSQVDLATIGFFSWVGITFSVKVFWAPIVDRLRLPLLNRLLGRRRGWMLLAQVGVAAGLAGMAATDPLGELTRLALLAVWVAFASATQDVAIDAFRIESASPEYQGAMAGMYIFGYRVALLVAGAGAFYIAEFVDWRTAYLTMAVLMGVGMITTLVVREPEATVSRDSMAREQRVVDFLARSAHLPQWLRSAWAWFIGAVVCPFTDFFRRMGGRVWLVLALVALYRLSDITMGVMANPFYLDLGFTKDQIASVAKVFGFGMLLVGSVAGGVLVVRFGILRPLLLGAVLVASTNLLFAFLAKAGPDLAMLAVVISADNLSGGLATAAFIAWLSSLTNTAYTATQYALFSSLMTLPAKFLGGFSGIVVEAYGYFNFFVYAALIGIPAILLALHFALRQTPVADEDAVPRMEESR
ncbi:MAG: AmpG family muropeptide MFS transporter [Gammaproteobacteria bacterium]|nr:AmpG family muropeptide MFS transporter [Gammaproteobacteria bacterium]NIR83146.1 AmpG family muropeptide MFS transporter [Gammaproteobacteria bacterium]NIR90954.1 AmpG family muropeptide MFS transporter [Gammaproteobacteria bacterium]NIU04311.1 AmpG family muropeptide MFS transporter [Gammaproteobacteria bacterium]NIV52534.1 AmpG family muropeptide MFS transporter [Gammaproteobacteria bacterium]